MYIFVNDFVGYIYIYSKITLIKDPSCARTADQPRWWGQRGWLQWQGLWPMGGKARPARIAKPQGGRAARQQGEDDEAAERWGKGGGAARQRQWARGGNMAACSVPACMRPFNGSIRGAPVHSTMQHMLNFVKKFEFSHRKIVVIWCLIKLSSKYSVAT